MGHMDLCYSSVKLFVNFLGSVGDLVANVAGERKGLTEVFARTITTGDSICDDFHCVNRQGHYLDRG